MRRTSSLSQAALRSAVRSLIQMHTCAEIKGFFASHVQVVPPVESPYSAECVAPFFILWHVHHLCLADVRRTLQHDCWLLSAPQRQPRIATTPCMQLCTLCLFGCLTEQRRNGALPPFPVSAESVSAESAADVPREVRVRAGRGCDSRGDSLHAIQSRSQVPVASHLDRIPVPSTRPL
jgi:hypothetical protein